MLHLAGSIGLGVDVADLLELERALHGDGHADPSAEEERAVGVLVRLSARLEVVELLEDRLDDIGKLREALP